jgi:hypothetical protein
MTKRKSFDELAKLGRPPKDGPKPVLLNVLVPPDVKEKLRELADESEMSLSAYAAQYFIRMVRGA